MQCFYFILEDYGICEEFEFTADEKEVEKKGKTTEPTGTLTGPNTEIEFGQLFVSKTRIWAPKFILKILKYGLIRICI